MSVLQSVTQDNSLGMVMQIQRGCQRRDRTRGAVETEVTCGAKNYMSCLQMLSAAVTTAKEASCRLGH